MVVLATRQGSLGAGSLFVEAVGGIWRANGRGIEAFSPPGMSEWKTLDVGASLIE